VLTCITKRERERERKEEQGHEEKREGVRRRGRMKKETE